MACSRTSHGWITYLNGADIDNFLTRHRPSEERNPNIFWISANSPKKDMNPGVPRDEYAAVTRWNALQKEGTKLNGDDVKVIAQHTNFTTGKWLIFRNANTIDDMWALVAKATISGQLGTAAKVSSRSSAQSQSHHQHVTCVYTEDYTNEADVMRVEAELRKLGIEGKLGYKPDIYTILGIYFRNPWNIKATVYNTNG